VLVAGMLGAALLIVAGSALAAGARNRAAIVMGHEPVTLLSESSEGTAGHRLG